MSKEFRKILFQIIDTLNEIKFMIQEEKNMRERAIINETKAKEAIAEMTKNMPPEIRSMIEPLLKMEK